MTNEATQPMGAPLGQSEAAARIDKILNPAPKETPDAQNQQAEAPKGKANAAEEGADAEATQEDNSSEESVEKSGEEEATQEETYTLPASIDDLANDLGVEPHQLESLKVHVKIDGESAEIPLKDVIASYQLQGHVNKKSMAVSEERKQVEALKSELTSRKEMLENSLYEADTMITLAEQQLLGEYKAIDWNLLRQQDPSQYAVLRQDYSDKMNSIEQAKQRAFGEIEKKTQELQKAEQENYRKHVSLEYEALLSKLPEWKDESKRTTDLTEIESYLKSVGFSDDEQRNIIDHRMLMVAKEAAAYRRAKTNALNNAKKLPKVTPVMKGGQRVDADVVKAGASAKTFEKLKQSGHLDDAAAMISQKFSR